MTFTKDQVKEIFAGLDKNGDGSLTLKELRAAFPKDKEPEMQAFIKSCDKNADNKVTLDELCKLLGL